MRLQSYAQGEWVTGTGRATELFHAVTGEKIAEAGGMRSLEVVEINTALDFNNKTAELGVELILSALGKTIL